MLWCLYMQPLLDSLLKVDGKVQTLGIVGPNGEFSINNVRCLQLFLSALQANY